ncbi:MAG: HPr family phosphocarrier protein [Lachnospiraceae bacterium]|nr:HPr family phosphocarrier protein [Lachnospiraceae bacterium]
MVSKKVKIPCSAGLHLKPAGRLCNCAMRYDSRISFEFENTVANAKSVLSVLGACIRCGDEVTFICEGADEEEALAAVIQCLEDDREEE